MIAVLSLSLAGCGRGGEQRRVDGSTAATRTAVTATTTTRATGSSGSTGTTSVAAPTSRPRPPSTRTGSSTAPSDGIPAALLGLDVERIPTSRRVVALTFDAGGDARGLPKILDVLARERVAATFFLTGRFAEDNPSVVATLTARGYRLGNHSVSHPHFTGLTSARIRDEVLGAERRILAGGGGPRPLFRFPFGDRDARTIAAVNGLGYVAVRWTVDTLGWKGTSGEMTAGKVTDRVLAGLQPGEIVLMHVGANPDDGTTLDADALPTVVARIRARGYGFVTLDALLR